MWSKSTHHHGNLHCTTSQSAVCGPSLWHMIKFSHTGKASFTSCSNATQFSCSHPHHFHITAGQIIEFDTRITLDSCPENSDKKQIILLQMFKGEICEQNIQFECRNTGQSKGCIEVIQVTDHMFDMKLRLHNAALNDAEVYTVQVKVINPDITVDSFFSRRFEVYMIGKSWICKLCYRSCGRITTIMYIQLVVDLNSHLVFWKWQYRGVIVYKNQENCIYL